MERRVTTELRRIRHGAFLASGRLADKSEPIAMRGNEAGAGRRYLPLPWTSIERPHRMTAYQKYMISYLHWVITRNEVAWVPFGSRLGF